MDCGGFMLELPQSHNSTLQEKEIVSLLGRGTIKIIPQLETQRGFFSSVFFCCVGGRNQKLTFIITKSFLEIFIH